MSLNPEARAVFDAAELARAVADRVAVIEVQGVITGSPMITLPPGTTLCGGTVQFGARGVRLTSNNVLGDIVIEAPATEAAVSNDTSVADMGTLTLRNVTTRGQVLLQAADKVRSGHVLIDTLNVAAADLRGRFERPHGFGVDVLPGAFTLWNRQRDPSIDLTAVLLDISAGTAAEPVRGSGVFVAGFADPGGERSGGTVHVSRLRTGEVHTHGGIGETTPDLISGGVFVLGGAIVDEVVSSGPVVSYGPNDMVLDNWGEVSTWTVTAPVTSYGPSGIGFVQFGSLDLLDVRAPVHTSGRGARGLDVYDGTLREARFTAITTIGDGAVAVQVSKPLGTLTVTGDVTTSGGSEFSLERGVQLQLGASALSIEGEAVVDAVDVGGKLASSGDRVTTLELLGTVLSLAVAGGVTATGSGSDAVHIAGNATAFALLDDIAVQAKDGEDVVRV